MANRHVAFSLRNSSPSSSSSASSSRIANASKKPGNLGTHGPDRINYEEHRVSLIPSSLSSKAISSPRKKLPLISKSLFGQKALWRKILFTSTKFRSIILLNAITIVYASNIAVVKEVEEIMDPAAFSVVRFVVAAIPFTPFVARSLSDAETRNSGIELGFWVSLGYLMQALGLLTSDAGRASFISIFTIIVVPLLDGMLGAIIPARTWFGALMSILGVWMLESSGSSPCIGDLLNFLSAVFFGVHMLRTEHISRTTAKDKFLPLLGYETCVVALSSMVWYFAGTWSTVFQGYDPSSWTWDSSWEWMVAFPWIPALYTGAFSTGVCLWIEMTAMRDVSAADTAVIYGLEPLWGAGFAWFILGERWGTAGWIGAALVLEVQDGIYFVFFFAALMNLGLNPMQSRVEQKKSGSLTVQLFGSSPLPKSTRESKESREDSDCSPVSDKQKVMAQMAKSMIEVEINVSADKIFQAIKATSRSVPKLSPEKILSVEEQFGDGCKGTKNWTLSVDGKVEKMKERVEIDEENKSMTVFVFDGDVMENYSSFKCNLQIIPKHSEMELGVREASLGFSCS
ncbi:unnamed protein product [Thlaspi arvense]|uniref:Bet v I/Major latex protein domain-containing protein n=1 Tax=Thlaspi arvense TaxID=13288 RepID=A0AAU9SM64_THLAR|nr:unnamed protein product [Thlaspi arvense]